MFAWAQLLFSRAPPHTPLTRYTLWNGVLYLLLGVTLLVWPGFGQVVFRAPQYQAGEAGLVRTIGMLLAIIGYLYVFGARTGQDRFAVSTILDRLILPFLLVALILAGQLAPELGVPFAILDPALGIGAWMVFVRSRSPGAATAVGR